jgi:hypothetical protein
MKGINEIVGARIGSIITNDLCFIKKSVDEGCMDIQLLSRAHMRVMAAFDLGPRWTAMANGPTLFYLNKKGKLAKRP